MVPGAADTAKINSQGTSFKASLAIIHTLQSLQERGSSERAHIELFYDQILSRPIRTQHVDHVTLCIHEKHCTYKSVRSRKCVYTLRTWRANRSYQVRSVLM